MKKIVLLIALIIGQSTQVVFAMARSRISHLPLYTDPNWHAVIATDLTSRLERANSYVMRKARLQDLKDANLVAQDATEIPQHVIENQPKVFIPAHKTHRKETISIDNIIPHAKIKQHLKISNFPEKYFFTLQEERYDNSNFFRYLLYPLTAFTIGSAIGITLSYLRGFSPHVPIRVTIITAFISLIVSSNLEIAEVDNPVDRLFIVENTNLPAIKKPQPFENINKNHG